MSVVKRARRNGQPLRQPLIDPPPMVGPKPTPRCGHTALLIGEPKTRGREPRRGAETVRCLDCHFRGLGHFGFAKSLDLFWSTHSSQIFRRKWLQYVDPSGWSVETCLAVPSGWSFLWILNLRPLANWIFRNRAMFFVFPQAS